MDQLIRRWARRRLDDVEDDRPAHTDRRTDPFSDDELNIRFLARPSKVNHAFPLLDDSLIHSDD